MIMMRSMSKHVVTFTNGRQYLGTRPTHGRALKQLKKINIVTRYVKRTKMGKQKVKKEVKRLENTNRAPEYPTYLILLDRNLI